MKRLAVLRKRAHFTKTQLAERSGVAISIIVRLENGSRPSASYETVVRLARALGVTTDELCPVPRRRRPRRPSNAPLVEVNGGEG